MWFCRCGDGGEAYDDARAMSRYAHDTDRALVQLLVRGDAGAFQEIYNRYAQPLYRYVANRIHSPADSEEIIQELFVRLWEKRTTLAHVNPLKPYLYRAVRNRLVNYIEHHVVRDQYAEHYKTFMATYSNATEETTNVTDFDSILEKTIAPLPENCKTAFRLSRLEQWPIARIAARMNLSHRTIENYIGQALKHLRNVWGGHFKN